MPPADAHGDVVTTVEIPATQTDTATAVGITGWADYTECGNPAATSSPAAIGTVGGGGRTVVPVCTAGTEDARDANPAIPPPAGGAPGETGSITTRRMRRADVLPTAVIHTLCRLGQSLDLRK